MELPPSVEPPSAERLGRYAEAHGFELSEQELSDFTDLAAGKMRVYRRLDELPEPRPTPAAHTDRTPGHRPGPEADPDNAFVTKCEVRGAEAGPLDGYDIGVKDNIAVAGVELTAASKVLEGYVPLADATAVTRLLDAGATIVGKLNMDDMAWSGSGELGLGGPIRNPRDADYLAGGSSGGNAVALVNGDVDIALGTDQAGSIRFPAAWCGCVGLKPTYGLVPYTGCIRSGPTYDHCGPMAMTVEDCALALDVLAGHDPLDPRQHPGTDPAGSYAHALPGDPDDLTVGVVMEGFGIDDGVDGTVRNALAEFETAGATVEELSIPWHTHALDIWIAVTTEEGVSIARDERVGHYLQGHYDTHFLKNYARARRGAGEKFPPTVKLKTLVGEYMMDRYHGYYHAKAQNLRRRLTAAYDDALESVDVLAMPTVPVTAYERESDLTRKELLRRAQGKAKRGKNTTAFNMTGHPAISVPCGNADELPVGLMFAAPHQADETLLSAADAFERSVEWRSVTP